MQIINKILNLIREKFEITAVDVDTFVGMKIVRERAKKYMLLHQASYIDKNLEKFKMLVANAVSTPMEKNVNLAEMYEHSQSDKILPYRELIGCMLPS